MSFPPSCHPRHPEPGGGCTDTYTWAPRSLAQRWSSLSPKLATYVAAVVNEASEVATLGGVNDGIMVHSEHVAATDALILVSLLPHICDHLATKQRKSGWPCVQPLPTLCLVHWVALTWRMFWPTYSMTISSAAMGSMANRPQS